MTQGQRLKQKRHRKALERSKYIAEPWIKPGSLKAKAAKKFRWVTFFKNVRL